MNNTQWWKRKREVVLSDPTDLLHGLAWCEILHIKFGHREVLRELSTIRAEARREAVNDKLKLIFLGIAGFLVASVPVFAHHGNAQYESKVLTLKGTVTAWLWTNPHVFLKVDVKGWQRCSCGRSQGQRREVTNRVRWPDNAASETAAKAKI